MSEWGVPVVEVKLMNPPSYGLFRPQVVPLSALVDDGTYQTGWRVTLLDGSTRQVLRGGRFARYLDNARSYRPRSYEGAYRVAKRIAKRLAYLHMKSGVCEWSTAVKPHRDADFYLSPTRHAADAASTWNSNDCLNRAMTLSFWLRTKPAVYFELKCRVVVAKGVLRAVYDPRRWISKPHMPSATLEQLVNAGMWTPTEATLAQPYE